MRFVKLALYGAALSAGFLLAGCVTQERPDYAKLVASQTQRPESDTKRDADRKPAEMLAFADVLPGQVVVDVIPGRGYFTRLFSAAVGAQGKVFAYIPTELDEIYKKNNIAIPTGADPAWPNVTSLHQPLQAFKVPMRVDLVWTSQNYHDMKDKFMGPIDIAKFNKAVFDALKPGGTYIVLDHAALADAPVDVTETLHRIQEETVKKEVLTAGFVLAGESDVLRNKDDPRTKNVFDPSIRGKTDQFILKFKKPN